MSEYHKAIVAAIAGAVTAFLGVVAGAMTVESTFSDVSTQTWLLAVIAAFGGGGVTGGATAVSKANAAPGPVDPNEDERD